MMDAINLFLIFLFKIYNLIILYIMTALVLGNGRSLKGFDFKSIPKGIDTIGCGLAFRYWQEINWYPSI